MTKGESGKPSFIESQASPKAISKTNVKVRAKLRIRPKIRKNPSAKVKGAPSSIQIPFEPISEQIPVVEESPKIEGYAVVAEQSPSIATEDEMERRSAAQLTAQELLDKPLHELEKDLGKREAQNMLKSMKIITAIMLGKNKNKELSQVLNTDKSFASKQIKDLEERGLVKREGEGKETTYAIDRFNLMKFLESKVVIKWGKSKPKEPNTQENGDLKDGRNKKNS
jgi:predicted transcriptional regulator